jgi:uncharacterized membrane protein
MVLDLKEPQGTDLAALGHVAPGFLIYVLSFVYVGIYWNNHHHFFQLIPRVNGAILWANLHLLFWLSLVPYATGWLGANHSAAVPTAAYGVALLMPALAWFVLQATVIHAQGPASPLRQALGGDLKGKVSPLLYAAGIALAFVNPLLSDAVYALVAIMWLIPDRRIEGVVEHRH